MDFSLLYLSNVAGGSALSLYIEGLVTTLPEGCTLSLWIYGVLYNVPVYCTCPLYLSTVLSLPTISVHCTWPLYLSPVSVSCTCRLHLPAVCWSWTRSLHQYTWPLSRCSLAGLLETGLHCLPVAGHHSSHHTHIKVFTGNTCMLFRFRFFFAN